MKSQAEEITKHFPTRAFIREVWISWTNSLLCFLCPSMSASQGTAWESHIHTTLVPFQSHSLQFQLGPHWGRIILLCVLNQLLAQAVTTDVIPQLSSLATEHTVEHHPSPPPSPAQSIPPSVPTRPFRCNRTCVPLLIQVHVLGPLSSVSSGTSNWHLFLSYIFNSPSSLKSFLQNIKYFRSFPVKIHRNSFTWLHDPLAPSLLAKLSLFSLIPPPLNSTWAVYKTRGLKVLHELKVPAFLILSLLGFSEAWT